MRDTETKTIDGHTYIVEAMGTKRAREVQFRLLRIAGPLFASLLAKDSGALSSALRNADPSDVNWLCDAFAETTKVQIKTGETVSPPMRLVDVYDAHFRRRSKAHLDWLWFCVEVNFSDFFDGMPPGLRGIVSKMPEAGEE